jgi:DNA-binding HxlR family transcriptional regulator
LRACCGSRTLGDQWVLLILREAFYGITRFETMREHTKMTKQTLANRLKKMTELGLLCKMPYQEEGARERYEYVLTPKSRSLAPLLISLMEWGHKNILHDEPHISLVDKRTGMSCTVPSCQQKVMSLRLKICR